MPWKNQSLEVTIERAKKIILKELNLQITSELFTCSKDEMIRRCTDELKEKIKDEKIVNREIMRLAYIYGKYFAGTNEIWVVEKIGENIDVLIHEMIHSIQVCKPNREGIVDYLTFKFTKNESWINSKIIEDWREIEKMVGIQAIKEKIVKNEDCEEF